MKIRLSRSAISLAHLEEVHHLAGPGGAFNLEVVAVVEVEVQERPDDEGVHRHPDRPPPVGVAAEHAGVRLGRQVVHPVLLAIHVENIRVLLVELGERTDAVGAQELVLVEHLRQNPAQPLRGDQSTDPALGHAEMARARGVDSLEKLGNPAQAFRHLSHRLRNTLPLPLLHHRGGTQGQQPHHRAHLEPRGAAVGEPQQVVIEAVFLVPHAVRPGPVHGPGDIVEVLHELYDHVLVGAVVDGELYGEFHHVLAEEGHPGGAVRLLQVAAGGERGAAVEDADVVEAEEAPLEDVLAEAVLAVHPPGEVQQELIERPLEEIQVYFAAPGLLGAMEKQGRPGVHRGVDVAEVPLVGGHLAAGVQVDSAKHQFHLLLGEVGVDDGERQRVEGQVPGRVPGVLPLVGHGDDVLVHHMVPLPVPEVAAAAIEGVGVVLVQPLVTVEEVELLGPEHAGDGLAHDIGRIRGDRGRGDGPVELVRLLQPGGQGLVKLRAERGGGGVWIFGLQPAAAWAVRRSRTVADWPGPMVNR